MSRVPQEEPYIYHVLVFDLFWQPPDPTDGVSTLIHVGSPITEKKKVLMSLVILLGVFIYTFMSVILLYGVSEIQAVCLYYLCAYLITLHNSKLRAKVSIHPFNLYHYSKPGQVFFIVKASL